MENRTYDERNGLWYSSKEIITYLLISIIPADYKDQGRQLLYEVSPLAGRLFLIKFAGATGCYCLKMPSSSA